MQMAGASVTSSGEDHTGTVGIAVLTDGTWQDSPKTMARLLPSSCSTDKSPCTFAPRHSSMAERAPCRAECSRTVTVEAERQQQRQAEQVFQNEANRVLEGTRDNTGTGGGMEDTAWGLSA